VQWEATPDTFSSAVFCCAFQACKKRLDWRAPVIYIARSFLRAETRSIMRRPKGIKTNKSASKRFKITARGKVLRSSAGRRHLCQTKNPKRRRSLRGTSTVDKTDEYRIKQSMPFTR
jgi:large subunit ribosomal protein L35